MSHVYAPEAGTAPIALYPLVSPPPRVLQRPAYYRMSANAYAMYIVCLKDTIAGTFGRTESAKFVLSQRTEANVHILSVK